MRCLRIPAEARCTSEMPRNRVLWIAYCQFPSSNCGAPPRKACRWRALGEPLRASFRPPPAYPKCQSRDSAYFSLPPLAAFLVPFFLAIAPPFLLDGCRTASISLEVDPAPKAHGTVNQETVSDSRTLPQLARRFSQNCAFGESILLLSADVRELQRRFVNPAD